MPINAGSKYFVAKQKYEQARTPLEKLAALEEMKSSSPKHKGAENLNAEINRKIAQTKNEMEKEKRISSKRGGSGSNALSVKKEGAGQLVLIGLPNAGKTSFFNQMTHLQMEVGDYPFTTKKPQIGMMNFHNARIQLVDLPPIVEGSSDGKSSGNQVLGVARNADGIILFLEAKNDEKEFEILSKELKNAGIIISHEKPKISITPSSFPGISVTGKEFLQFPYEQLVSYLKSIGMFNAQIVLREKTTLDLIAEALNEKNLYKKCAIIYTKGNPSQKIFMGKEIPQFIVEKIIPESQYKEIIEKVFPLLNKVYVFTKKPGQAPALEQPLILNAHSTIEEAAKIIHKEMAQNLKYAKIWGSAKFEGQRVSKGYVLQNGDIIEFYW